MYFRLHHGSQSVNSEEGVAGKMNDVEPQSYHQIVSDYDVMDDLTFDTKHVGHKKARIINAGMQRLMEFPFVLSIIV